jgi:hypothetical protein
VTLASAGFLAAFSRPPAEWAAARHCSPDPGARPRGRRGGGQAGAVLAAVPLGPPVPAAGRLHPPPQGVRAVSRPRFRGLGEGMWSDGRGRGGRGGGGGRGEEKGRAERGGAPPSPHKSDWGREGGGWVGFAPPPRSDPTPGPRAAVPRRARPSPGPAPPSLTPPKGASRPRGRLPTAGRSLPRGGAPKQFRAAELEAVWAELEAARAQARGEALPLHPAQRSTPYGPPAHLR